MIWGVFFLGTLYQDYPTIATCRGINIFFTRRQKKKDIHCRMCLIRLWRSTNVFKVLFLLLFHLQAKNSFNPNRFLEQNVDYQETTIEAKTWSTESLNTLNMLSKKALCPCFVEAGVPLPLMGGHNICPCWSSPGCRQYRTSGVGTVEREKKKEKHGNAVVVHVSLIRPSQLPEDVQRQRERSAAESH